MQRQDTISIALLFAMGFLFAALIVVGVMARAQTERVCTGTSNYALCDLSLQAGDSEETARNAGNGIFN